MHALSAALLAAGAASAAQGTGSRVPDGMVEAFLGDCRTSISEAGCACFVRELQATPEGDFILDVAAYTLVRKASPAGATAEDRKQVLARHGLKPAEAVAILEETKPVMDKALKSCV